VERGIVKDASALDVETNIENEAVRDVDLQGLVDSEWVAFTFAEANRDLLGIPDDAQFEVLKRVVVDGRFKSPATGVEQAITASPTAIESDAEDEVGSVPFRELLFKVRWSQVEDNPPDLGATKRRVQTGTTLVIDWNAKRIRSLLRPLDFEGRRPARDAMLRRLIDRGIVEVTEPDPSGRAKAGATGIDGVVTDGILRIRNTARLLHIVKELDE
jgi:hypothetical protein